MNRRQLNRQLERARQEQQWREELRRISIRKHLSADALIGAVRESFEDVAEPCNGDFEIPIADALMTGYAVLSLKSPSLLAFEKKRIEEEHNLKSIYGIGQIPCDSQLRARLDPVEPDSLRPAYSEIFRRAQRGKLIEEMTYLDGCVLISGDGTTYYISENLASPACLKKTNSKTGAVSYSMQVYGAVIVHPDRKEVIPLPPEPIFNHDGDNKNDCERNACKRWLPKFRKEHPHLKAVMVEDGLSSNAPHIRDLIEHGFHYILGLKEGDHVHLSQYLDAAVEKGEAVEYDIPDPQKPEVHHFFRLVNNAPLNASNRDLLVNVLEYWEQSPKGMQRFSWITDFTLTHENAYAIMRGGRARWRVENETFNTLKNQGYHLEHNYGLGKKNLSMVFVMLTFLAFLVDQIQQMSCPLFRAALKKAGSKRELWERIRSVFHVFVLDSMEMLFRLILAGPHQISPQALLDTS